MFTCFCSLLTAVCGPCEPPARVLRLRRPRECAAPLCALSCESLVSVPSAPPGTARCTAVGRGRDKKALQKQTPKVLDVTGPTSIYILTMPTVLYTLGCRWWESEPAQDTFSPPWAGPCRPTPHRRSSRRTQWRGRPQDLPQTRPRTVQPADPRSQR